MMIATLGMQSNSAMLGIQCNIATLGLQCYIYMATLLSGLQYVNIRDTINNIVIILFKVNKVLKNDLKMFKKIKTYKFEHVFIIILKSSCCYQVPDYIQRCAAKYLS